MTKSLKSDKDGVEKSVKKSKTTLIKSAKLSKEMRLSVKEKLRNITKVLLTKSIKNYQMSSLRLKNKRQLMNRPNSGSYNKKWKKRENREQRWSKRESRKKREGRSRKKRIKQHLRACNKILTMQMQSWHSSMNKKEEIMKLHYVWQKKVEEGWMNSHQVSKEVA